MELLIGRSHRIVHVDLKGAPPKLSYFEKFFPFIKDLGATGVLLEWEDTFPFTGELLQIGGLSNSAQVSGAPYTIEEARQILNLAADSDLIVIPLVQTFGHMEYVLKHEPWKNLREFANYPSSMCPSNSGTLNLVRNMVKQIITFHNDIEYIHIGADEVWHMGMCETCSQRIKEEKYGKQGLYLEHICEVARYIKENYPTLKVIIWDDMLRSIDLKILQEYYIGNLVEPMVWHYNSIDTFNLLNGVLWEKYGTVFKNIWCASAFKGATSSCQILPVNKYHISNHEAWLRELSIHAGKINVFRGIVLTGWSRFDHYATLCELLPCGIPSLCLCLKTWLKRGHSQELHNAIGRMLGYNENTTNFGSPIKTQQLPQLTFPGWQIFVGFEWFVGVKTKYKNIIDSDQMNTWFNQWQVQNNYTNPMQIDTILPVVIDCLNETISVEAYLRNHLEQIFFPHTLEELFGTLFRPMKQHLSQIQKECETQLTLGCRVRGHRRINI